MTTILIAEDHALILDAWTMILKQDGRFKIIGTCSDAEAAVSMSALFQPNIVLMDINLKPFSGIEATRQILKISHETRIIAVTMHNQPEFVRRILEAGALGYVTKNSSSAELITAIMEVSVGNVFICSEMRQLLSAEPEGTNRFSALDTLTAREKQIIHLIRLGLSSRDISETLQISFHTVEVHRYNLMKKLKVKNVASLIELMNANEMTPL